MRTNLKNHPVFKYLINQLPTVEQITNEYGTNVEDTIKARLEWVLDTFSDEYYYPENVKRYGNRVNVFSEWLRGLPSAFSVDFENSEIVKLAKEWGSIPQDATEKQEQKIIDNWFNFAAVKFFQLCKQHKVETYA